MVFSVSVSIGPMISTCNIVLFNDDIEVDI